MTEELSLETRIIKFLKEYRDENNRLKYIDIINALPALEDKVLVIEFNDILFFERELAKELTENPYQFIDAAKRAVLEILKIERPLDAPHIRKEDIYVSISGEEPGYSVKLRDISSKYVGKLITLKGLLVKVTQVFSIPKKAVYVCEECGEEYVVEIKNILDRLIRPKCRHGRRSYNCNLSKDKTVFTDIQYARIQERPDELPPGQIPRFIDVIFEKPMIDRAYPGDIVKIIGILDINERRRRDRVEYDFILIGNYIESREKEAFEVIITKQEEQEIRRKAKEPDFYKRLIDSFAPSIYGYREVKEALLLSLIGGETRILRDGTKLRGNIHLLLVGDPGLAKSQLLKYAAYVAPKGIYTSGRGSTAAGLTAAVIKEAGGGMSLEAGAVVLADMGICAIDEIDKMRNEDRVALHEAMEQQSYHKDTELILADGRKIKIGVFIDKLIESNRDKVIIGKDTEVLPVKDLCILAFDARTKSIVVTKADRVSRHRAPDKFIKIKYSNGRTIVVTPEHPVPIFNDDIETVRADCLKEGMLVPGISRYLFINSHFKPELEVNIEDHIKLLAYILSSNLIVKPDGVIVKFYSENVNLIEDYIRLLDGIGLKYNLHIDEFYNVELNLKELSKKLLGISIKDGDDINQYPLRRFYRLPSWIYSLKDELKTLFLSTYFKISGFSEGDRVGYLVNNYKLGEDIQDLLLSLEILSYIVDEGTGYKLVISEPDTFYKSNARINRNKFGLDQNLVDKFTLRFKKVFDKLYVKTTRVIEGYVTSKNEENGLFNILELISSQFHNDIIPIKIEKVEVIKNNDSRWVYDITVEPYHLFISHGLVLHNTVSISKGGIIATLNARTTIIAASNPVDGVYNPYKPLVSNINLPVTLLSRFDLIHVIRDELSEERDRKLTEHMMLTRESEIPFMDTFDVDFMRKFIAYARKVKVTMAKKASDLLKDYFIKMRRLSSATEEITAVPITPRQFEALIRLAEASAKAHLRTRVTEEDAKIAIAQINLYLQRAAMDITTQQLDVTQIMTGTPARKASKTNTILGVLRELKMQSGGKPVSEEGWINEVIRRTHIKDRDAILEVIEKLKRDGIIYEPMPSFYDLVYSK